MQWVIENAGGIYVAVTTTVTAAAAIAALTKSPKDDAVVAILRKVVDAIAFNWGNARNAR